MLKNQKSVLIITPAFRPNVGGAETYVNELCEYLRTHNHYVYVLTYQPITTPDVKGKRLERLENMEVRRFWWMGYNLFHKTEEHPVLNFLYVTPYLFLRCFWWMLWNHKKIDVIDVQGFNSAFIGRILKKLFRKKAIVSVMSLYDFVPDSGLAKKVAWIIKGLDHVIVESKVSKKELMSIGVPPEKITPYVEWVDIERFRPQDREELRRKLGIPNTFTVLFVGRAIKIKGADILLEVADQMQDKNINFVFISNAGPMMDELRRAGRAMSNVTFIGGVAYEKLHNYYAAADLFVIPSRYSENAARTVVEAIACGTPVIGTNLGAIPSLINNSVGILVKPEVADIESAVRKLFNNRNILRDLTNNCRPYALKNFSSENAMTIINCY